MAALTVQSVATAGSAPRGLALVSKKAIGSVRAGSLCTLSLTLRKNSGLSVRGSVKSRRVGLKCRASDKEVSEEDVDVSDNLGEMDLSEMKARKSEPGPRTPKFTTLRPFGEGGVGVMSGLEGSVFELLAANVQAIADLKRFETLSGRMAMLAFFGAIGVEVVTGNSVFTGIDVVELVQFAALAGVAAVTAAGFAVMWRARSDVASSLSKSAIWIVDAAVDNVIDGLFYDEEEKLKD